MNAPGTSAPCHVAYCFDGAYALLTGVSLTSLLHHHPGGQIHVHCLVRNVGNEDRERLLTTARRYDTRLDFIELDDAALQGLPLEGHLSSPMIYARLLLPSLLPAELERVLYLDSDSVVLGSLLSLFALDLGDHALAAVPDSAHGPMGQRFNLPPQAYFNAGVQLMHLPNWRAQNISRRCFDTLADRGQWPSLQALDQDALNLQLRGNYLRLPERYNHAQYHQGQAVVLGTAFHYAPPGPDTVLIQFLGRVKPHMAWYQGPGLAEFNHFLSLSEWRDAPLKMPVTVADLVELADKLCAEDRATEAAAHLRRGLLTLADRIAKEMPA
ncbi:MAG TPA: glycosyltransferase family 8 protein [Rhodocyclaceae bacterium]|nr:glycosyltransferase family 8 protein [Rhodocyclaceae bacterium]